MAAEGPMDLGTGLGLLLGVSWAPAVLQPPQPGLPLIPTNEEHLEETSHQNIVPNRAVL